MRSTLSLGLLAVVSIVTGGCATSMGSANGQERVVVAVDAPPQRTTSDTVEITEIVPPVAVEAAPARRRLSQTVTLGQGTSEPIYAAAPAQQAQGGSSQNVTVNNNVTVVQQPPVYYGGYGGYGSYGRGYGSGYSEGSRGTSGRQAWAPSGWEGAGRTAAPGRTPGVGGNFAPAPSFGPRQMK